MMNNQRTHSIAVVYCKSNSMQTLSHQLVTV